MNKEDLRQRIRGVEHWMAEMEERRKRREWDRNERAVYNELIRMRTVYKKRLEELEATGVA